MYADFTHFSFPAIKTYSYFFVVALVQKSIVYAQRQVNSVKIYCWKYIVNTYVKHFKAE